MINTLQTGADDLTLADANEEGANMLALQTRQQLSIHGAVARLAGEPGRAAAVRLRRRSAFRGNFERRGDPRRFSFTRPLTIRVKDRRKVIGAHHGPEGRTQARRAHPDRRKP